MEEERRYDLEDRLIDFSVLIMNLAEELPATKAGQYVSGQIVRSGISSSLNYGEAKGAESINDFIHKMKICLKELRESQISLKIIERKPLILSSKFLEKSKIECNELISIFVKSIKTAEKRKISK